MLRYVQDAFLDVKILHLLLVCCLEVLQVQVRFIYEKVGLIKRGC